MKIVRPVRPGDLPALRDLAESAGIGLTTLPADERLLRARVMASLRAIDTEVIRPAGEAYLFVLQDQQTGAVDGTAGVVARVGGFEPFYSYRVERRVHASAQLGVEREVAALHLVADHKGPTEIGTLFLHPRARGGGAGRLLSLSRFLFIACFPERFDVQVLAEMRGVQTAPGVAPFWDAVGRHFFDLDFAEADAQSAVDKQFIADLMPKHPIYIPLLPPAVQAVIGQVHPETRPALALLRQEGFETCDEVDIFDAGPMVRAPRDQIRTVRESEVAVVAAVRPVAGPRLMISNTRLDFRATLGAVESEGEGVAIAPAVAAALEVEVGATIRSVALRSPSARPSA